MGMKCNQAIGTIFDNVKKVGGSLTEPIREASKLYGSKEMVAPPEWAVKMAKSGGGMGTANPVMNNAGPTIDFTGALKRAHQTNGVYDIGKIAKTAGVIGAGGLAVGATRSIKMTKEDEDNVAIAAALAASTAPMLL